MVPPLEIQLPPPEYPNEEEILAREKSATGISAHQNQKYASLGFLSLVDLYFFFDRISRTFLIQAFQTFACSSSNGDSQFDSTNSYSDPESSSSGGKFLQISERFNSTA